MKTQKLPKKMHQTNYQKILYKKMKNLKKLKKILYKKIRTKK